MGFQVFFETLVKTEANVVHLFRRDSKDGGWPYFTAHGTQSVFLAQCFYKSQSVLKKDWNLDSLTLSRQMVAQVVAYLLNENMSVQIWAKRGELRSDDWVKDMAASPGNVTELEQEFGAVVAELNSTAVIAAVWITGGLKVGVATASVARHELTIFHEFIDSSDLSGLETVLVQHGVKEVLVSGEGQHPGSPGGGRVAPTGPSPEPSGGAAGGEALVAMLRRCGICLRVVPRGTFNYRSADQVCVCRVDIRASNFLTRTLACLPTCLPICRPARLPS
jgi:hypothetical protein